MTAQVRHRARLPSRWALAVVLGVPVLVLVGLFVTYQRELAFERVAARHLPPQTQLAVRVDLEQVVLFEPFRKHLLTGLNQATLADGGRSLVQSLDAATRGNLALELREIVYVGAANDQWLVVVGGLFAQRDLLQRVQQVLTADLRLDVELLGDGQVARIASWSLFCAQASDGAFLIASSEQLLRSALPQSERFRALGLPLEGAGGFAAVQPWGDGWVTALAPAAGLHGELALGDAVQVQTTVELQDGAGQTANPMVAMDEAKLHAVRLGEEWALLRVGLARARVLSSSEKRWVFHSFFERREIDEWSRELAARAVRRLRPR